MKRMKGLFKKHRKGFALMTVLLMTALLLVLMVSLLTLTSQTLYRATADVERAAAVPLAESAVNEALLRLQNDSNWGKVTTDPNAKVFMCAGGQDVSKAGLNSAQSPTSSNSLFSFGQQGCYYISFDPTDAKFATAQKYYSVNNLSGSTAKPSWRPGKTIPPYSASIVVTLAVGKTIKHLEVILKAVPSGGMKNGSKGDMDIGANILSLQKADTDSSTPELHSNYDPTVGTGNDTSVAMKALPGGTTYVDNPVGASISASDKITSTGITFKDNTTHNPIDPNSLLKGGQGGALTVPNLDPNALVSAITDWSTTDMPSGTYEVKSGALKYWKNDNADTDHDAPDHIYHNNDTIVPGVKFTQQSGLDAIQISKNVKVAYDSADPNGDGHTGNLLIADAAIQFSSGGYMLYLPGNGNKDPNSLVDPNVPAYSSGNLTVATWSSGNEMVKGEGSICCMGGMQLCGSKIDAGMTTKTMEFYARGDIDLVTLNNVKFKGLVYTNGDFIADIACSNDHGSCAVKCCHDPDLNWPNGQLHRGSQTLEIQGALIAAGRDAILDPNDPNVVISAASEGHMHIRADTQFTLTFDETVLGVFSGAGGGSCGLSVISWHEF